MPKPVQIDPPFDCRRHDSYDREKWLAQSGGGSDGVIAKRIDLPYQAGNRDGMQKIKKFRSADCVVGGFRYATNKQRQKVVGSLLLGLYDDDGLLHHVGFTSAIKQQEKPALTAKLEPLIAKPGFTGNAPGGPAAGRPSAPRNGVR